MAQHDFNINNQSAPAFRGDLNNALEALVTLSSDTSEPATIYSNMLWYKTDNDTLYIRSASDWVALGTLDQSTNTFAPAGVAELTQVQVEDDTSTVFGQVSGQRLAQAVNANLDTFATGGTGAPRILGRALAAPADVPTITVSAADTVVRAGSAALGLGYVEGTTSTTGSTYVVGATFTVSQAYSGSLRFYATQTSQYTGGSESGSATSSMYLRKNGVTISSVFTLSSGTGPGSTGTAARSFDSAIASGDVFEWMHSNSGFGVSRISDVEIGGSDLYVAATPMIKASESPF